MSPDAGAPPAIAAPEPRIVAYSAIEAGLSELRTKYSNAVFTVSTRRGLEEAREARGVLRAARLRLEDARKATKAESLAYGRLVDSEAARITAEISALEDPIAAQVKAEDDRKEAERQARARAEADRVALIRRRIDWIAGRVLEAAGKPPEAIAAILDVLLAVNIDAEQYAEFTLEAVKIHTDAVLKIRAMIATAIANAEESSRLARERERFEAERKERDARIAAEDAERARLHKLDDEARAAERAGHERIEAARKWRQDQMRQALSSLADLRFGNAEMPVAEIDERIARAEKTEISADMFDDTKAAFAVRDATIAALRELRRLRLEADALELRRKSLQAIADPWGALIRIRYAAEGIVHPEVARIFEIADEALKARSELAGLET